MSVKLRLFLPLESSGTDPLDVRNTETKSVPLSWSLNNGSCARTGIFLQGFLIQILSGLSGFYLGPVGENLSVAAISDQFFRKLCNLRVQIVQNHVNHGSSVLGFGRDFVDRVSPS